jgi:inner membrane protein
MDTVTQFVLGAGVGAAVMGRRVGLRRAAIAGGVLATLPDADVFFPYEDDVARFIQHRGATHSLIMHALATPVIGEGLFRWLKTRRRSPGLRRLVYLAVFLCLTTHALLDALTIYGTQLFWPVWNEPIALGSMFIIDPAFTLPLLAVALWALFQRDWTRRYGWALTAALFLSTAYLGWSVAAQNIALSRADRALAAHGVTPSQRIATPTAFNTLFWRVIAMDGARYFSIYVPLLGGEAAVTTHAHRSIAPGVCIETNVQAKNLAAFAHGYYQIRRYGDDVILADLRMGLPPNYVFQFVIADAANPVLKAARRLPTVRSSDGDMAWLWAGIKGKPSARPAEIAARVDLTSTAKLAATVTSVLGC